MPLLVQLVVGAALVALAVQLVVPRIGQARIERRLTARGGETAVRVRAMPCLKLIWRRGDLIEVRGSRIEIGMSADSGGLGALDGFRVVDIVLTDFTTGPFEISEFELTRSGGGPYLMRVEALTSGLELVEAPQLGLGTRTGPLLGLLARGAPLGSRRIPVSVEVELISEKGLLTIASGGGSVAGLPAGRLATVLAATVARRLEISF